MSIFAELKRRNVFKVGIAYVLMAWVALQAADFALDLVDAPNWVIQTLFIIVIIGLPFALFFAWAFELTPEGIKREHEVDRGESIAPHTGKKLNFMIIGALTLAVAYLLVDKYVLEDMADQAAPRMVQQEIATGSEEAPVVDDNSIAVLPFANRSRSEDDEFFVDGMHDDLLTQLSKIQGLKVISRTTMSQYKDTEKTIPQIAEELGVSTILEGGVQRAGDRVRINAQLINPDGDGHIWAETYDREMTVENLFDIQSEITRQIVTAVRGELSEDEAASIAAMPTQNLEAYEAYLRGRQVLNQADYGSERAREAQKWMQQAVELDPGFGLAWASLAVANSEIVWMAEDNRATRELTQEALVRAEQLIPGAPETLLAQGIVQYRLHSNYRAATEYFRQAQAKAPADADIYNWLALAQRRSNEWDEALVSLQTATNLDPGNLFVKTTLIETLLMMNENERARPLLESWVKTYPNVPTFRSQLILVNLQSNGDFDAAYEALQELEPWAGVWYITPMQATYLYARDFQSLIDFFSSEKMSPVCAELTWKPFCEQWLAEAHHFMGQEETANYHANQVVELTQSNPDMTRFSQAQTAIGLASAYARLGEFDMALEAANRSVQLIPEDLDSLDGRAFAATRAQILGMAGQREEALVEIERLLGIPSGITVFDLNLNPAWDFFRDDPRFVALYGGDVEAATSQQPGDGP